MKKWGSVLMFALALSLSMMWFANTTRADEAESCGDGVTYTYDDETATLTLSYTGEGTGAMDGCTNPAYLPWDSSQIKNVEIGEGITEISEWAFYESQLEEVVIPSTVTRIGSFVFENCESLKTITLPRALTEIGEEAFNGCSALTTVYYYGSQDMWEEITIGDNNDLITKSGFATTHLHTYTEASKFYCVDCGYERAPYLMVEGTSLTWDNMSDITGDGTFSYDKTTKTLTIKKDIDYHGSAPLVYDEDALDLKVVIADTCTKISTYDYNPVFTGSNALTVNGSSLNVTVNNSTAPMFSANKYVTITTDNDITLTTYNGSIGNVNTLNGCNITVTSGSTATPAFNLPCSVIASGNETIKSAGPYIFPNTVTEDGKKLTSVVIAQGDVDLENTAYENTMAGYIGDVPTIQGANVTVYAKNAYQPLFSGYTQIMATAGDVKVNNVGCGGIGELYYVKGVNVKLSGNCFGIPLIYVYSDDTHTSKFKADATGDLVIHNDGAGMAVSAQNISLSARGVEIMGAAVDILLSCSDCNIDATGDVILSNLSTGFIGNVNYIAGSNVTITANSNSPAITSTLLIDTAGDVNITNSAGMAISGSINAGTTTTVNIYSAGMDPMVGGEIILDCSGNVSLHSEGGYVGAINSISAKDVSITSKAEADEPTLTKCGKIIATGTVTITNNGIGAAIITDDPIYIEAVGFYCASASSTTPTIVGNISLLVNSASIISGGCQAVDGDIDVTAKTGCLVTLKGGTTMDDLTVKKEAAPIEGFTCTDNAVSIDTKAAHSYAWKVTKCATTSAAGTLSKVCTYCGNVSNTSAISKITTIKLSKTSYVYDGKAKTPTLVIKDSAGKTISSKYYTVTKASGRKNVGTYTYKIVFKDRYKGTKTLSFKVIPTKTAITKLTATTKGFKATWKKVSKQATGYQIQICTSKKFKSGIKKYTVKSYKTAAKTIKKLTAKKTYYVRIRTYKTVNKKSYYSAWSAIKAVKTK